MSEVLHRPGDHRAARRPDRRPWQVGLRTVFLLTAVVAVWIAVSINRRDIATLESRIASMRSMARELVVEDATRIAVVKREELWYDDNGWEVYLPDGSYRLCLATRGVDQQGFAPGMKTTPVAPGRHRLTLDQTQDGEGRRIAAVWDGQKRLESVEPKGWDPGTGSSGGGEFSRSQQLPAGEPLVLLRRRFMGPRDAQGRSTTPDGPTEGILLWIERTGPPGR